MLCHLLSGAYVSHCTQKHTTEKCSCQTLGAHFSSEQELSFPALSILLSAFEDTLPDSFLKTIGDCLGLDPSVSASRIRVLAGPGSRRQTLLESHTSLHPSTSVFANIESLPKGTLLSLARSHGIAVESKNETVSSLRAAIFQHFSTGSCTSRERLVSHSACASLVSQFEEAASCDSSEGPSTLTQIHTLRQVAPLLSLKRLRRLLKMHDVFCLETDRSKQLKRRLWIS